MRQSRRGCFYQRKPSMYVWAVYNIAQVVDENTATTGSFTLKSTVTKQSSTAYTYSGSRFTLTDPVETPAEYLLGRYIVSVTTKTDSATSGTSLYLITSRSGTSSYTINYKKYTSLCNVKGDTYYYDVSSETLDYPINGIYGDYWYVLIEAPYQYIWDVYEYTTGLIESTATIESKKAQSTTSIVIGKDYSHYTSTSTTTGAVSHRFNLKSTSTVTYADVQVGDYTFFNDTAVSWSSTLCLVTRVQNFYGQVTITYKRYKQKGDERGDTRIDIVGSDNLADYPMDGVQGNYWYVLIYAGNSSNSKYVWDVYTISTDKNGQQSAGTYVLRLGSNTKDYPVDGISGTYWYVMVKGEYSVYVWNQYTANSQYVAVESTPAVYILGSDPVYSYTGSSYTLDQSTGKFTIDSATRTHIPGYQGPGNYGWADLIPVIRNKWWNISILSSQSSPSFSSLLYGYASSEEPTSGTLLTIYAEKQISSEVQYSNSNTATGVTKESRVLSAYPTNGYNESDGYWYVYSHAYSVPFDNIN